MNSRESEQSANTESSAAAIPLPFIYSYSEGLCAAFPRVQALLSTKSIVFPTIIMRIHYSSKTLKEEINFCLPVPQTIENERVLLECFDVRIYR
jgi:hypothetical protein